MTPNTPLTIAVLTERLEAAEARIHALEMAAMGQEDNTRRLYALERTLEAQATPAEPRRRPRVLDAGTDGAAVIAFPGAMAQ